MAKIPYADREKRLETLQRLLDEPHSIERCGKFLKIGTRIYVHIDHIVGCTFDYDNSANYWRLVITLSHPLELLHGHCVTNLQVLCSEPIIDFHILLREPRVNYA